MPPLRAVLGAHTVTRHPPHPRRRPYRAVRELVLVERRRQHLDAVARRHRRDVSPVLDDRRLEEVLVEVVDPLDHAVLERSAHARCSRRTRGAGRTRRGRRRPRAGTPGSPNFAASRRTAITSFTPPIRHASIWQTSIASAWNSCLKITRFWTCSPVATRIGAISRRMRAWPSTSSGLVGSSIHHGSYSPQAPHRLDRLVDAPHLVRVHHQRAVRPSASRMSARGGRRRDVAADLHLHVREAVRERLADERLAPSRRRSRASRPTSCRPGTRRATISRFALAPCPRAACRNSIASSGVRTSEM